MRKLKLQIQMSVDGFVAGPHGEQDWMTRRPDDEFLQFILSMADSSDTLLLGRKMTDDFIGHWERTLESQPDHPLARRMVDIPKVVFTCTLDESRWKNTTLARGELAQEVARLKAMDGKDMLVYGGVEFVSALVREDLIDAYYLIVNPVAIGCGQSIFQMLEGKRNFTPVESRLYSGGKVVLVYRPEREG